MRRGQVWCRWAIIIALPVIVGACAATPRDAALPLQDPNEHANRQMLAVNQEMMRPVAEAVQTIVPRPAHDRLRDFNSNLKEPRIFVNNLLQGRLDAASKTAARFAMNTTFGIGGLVDLASLEGIPQQTGDFGQTLFVWGVSEGPYMVRPLGSHHDSRCRRRRCRSLWRSGRLAVRNPVGRRGYHGRPRHGCQARPIEASRRCFHRLLQLHAFELLPNAPSGVT